MSEPAAAIGAGAPPRSGLEAFVVDATGRRTLDRIMVIVAHPDDETLGIGGHIANFRDVVVLHVTDGAPRDMKDARSHGFDSREAYAEARRREAETALAEAGLPRRALESLGIVDQEVALHLVDVSRGLAERIAEFCPGAVFTHAYEGGHPDHDAVAFAVQAATRLLAGNLLPPREGNRVEEPAVLEMPLYHAGADGAVRQRFAAVPDAPEFAVTLDDTSWERKQAMLARFATQRQVLAAFTSRVERFRRAPIYDFTQPPNGGAVLYERSDWGWTAARWCELARNATLDLGPAACR